MLTRRQKNSIRGLTAAMTCVALLSAFLIYTNISNTEEIEVVVFSDILEGAIVYADSDDSDAPAYTLPENELMETMFSEQYATFTLADDPSHDVTYISPDAAYPEDTRSDNDTIGVDTDEGGSVEDENNDEQGDRTDNSDGIPDNANEITLLHDQLDIYETEDTATTAAEDDTTAATSALTSGSGNNEDTTTTTTYITASRTTTSSSATTTEITPYFLTTGTTGTRYTYDTSSYTTTSARTTTSYRYTTTTTPATTTSRTTTTAQTTRQTTATTVTTKAKTTATPANISSHTSKTPFTNVGGGVFSNDDNVYLTLFRLVNNARRDAGLNELWYSARVHEVCQLRAAELSSYYSHNRPDGTRFSTAFKEIGINYELCGENIAYGRNMFETPEEVFKAWMDSQSHRENILNPDFECVAFGLSVLKVGNDTYYYWTQEFAAF